MGWSSLINKLHTPPPKPDGTATLINSLDIIRLLRSAGAALFAQVALHTELIRVEWAEEKNRLVKMLLLALFGFACGLCFLIFLGVFVLALTWDTEYRIHAVVALIALFGLGIFIAYRRFQKLSVLSPTAFAASREEIAADLALLKSAFIK
jgi:uncharacterized membrane protein YqjE